MQAEAATPPKSEWKVWRLLFGTNETGYLYVRAPSKQAAEEAGERVIGDGRCDLIEWPDPYDVDVELLPHNTEEAQSQEDSRVDVEWDPETEEAKVSPAP